QAAFLEGRPECWLPFWGVRYNLTGGQRVDPLRRAPVWDKADVLLVVPPDVRQEMPEAHRQRLADFAAAKGVKVVESKEELVAALEARRPSLMYCLCHADPSALWLGEESVSPKELKKLLRSRALQGPRQSGGLVFLNACRTAQAGAKGSFLGALH